MLFATLENLCKQATRNLIGREEEPEYIDAVMAFEEMRPMILKYIDPPDGRWGSDWSLLDMYVLGLGQSVHYTVLKRRRWFEDATKIVVTLDGKKFDSIVARKRWRKALLWAKAVAVVHERWMRCYEPDAVGMECAKDRFEERSGKRARLE